MANIPRNTAVYSAFIASLKILALSVLAGVLPLMLIWLPLRTNTTNIKNLIIDFSQKEHSFRRFSGAEEPQMYILWILPLSLFLPFTFGLYERLNLRRITIFLMFVSISNVPFFVVNVVLRISTIVSQMSLLTHLLAFNIYISIFFKGIPVKKAALKQTFLQAISFLVLQVVRVFSEVGISFSSSVTVLLIIPFLREFTLAVTRLALTDLLKEKRDTNKNASVMLLFWVQAFWSMLIRSNIITITDPAQQLLTAVLIGFEDIILRVSIDLRIRFNQLLLDLVYCKSRNKVHNATSPRDAAHIKASQEQRRRVLQLSIFGETIYDYLAIMLSPLLCYIFFPMRLGFPFVFYSSLTDPFKMGLTQTQTNGLLFGLVTQLIMKIIVDITCHLLEEKIYGKPLLLIDSIAHSQSERTRLQSLRWFFVFIAVSAYFGNNIFYLFITSFNRYNGCLDQLLCCCYNNGLLRDGLAAQYCELIEPNLTSFIEANCTY